MLQTYEHPLTDNQLSHEEIMRMGSALADLHINHRATLGEKAPLSRQERKQLVKILPPGYHPSFINQPRPAAPERPKVAIH